MNKLSLYLVLAGILVSISTGFVYGACSNDVSLGGQRIINLGEAEDIDDAVTKGYVDSLLMNSERAVPRATVLSEGFYEFDKSSTASDDFYEMYNYCVNLKEDGFENWRPPTFDELTRLLSVYYNRIEPGAYYTITPYNRETANSPDFYYSYERKTYSFKLEGGDGMMHTGGSYASLALFDQVATWGRSSMGLGYVSDNSGGNRAHCVR